MKNLFCLFACLYGLSLQAGLKDVAAQVVRDQRGQNEKLTVILPGKCLKNVFYRIKDDCPTPEIKPLSYCKSPDVQPSSTPTTGSDDEE